METSGCEQEPFHSCLSAFAGGCLIIYVIVRYRARREPRPTKFRRRRPYLGAKRLKQTPTRSLLSIKTEREFLLERRPGVFCLLSQLAQ